MLWPLLSSFTETLVLSSLTETLSFLSSLTETLVLSWTSVFPLPGEGRWQIRDSHDMASGPSWPFGEAQ